MPPAVGGMQQLASYFGFAHRRAWPLSCPNPRQLCWLSALRTSWAAVLAQFAGWASTLCQALPAGLPLLRRRGGHGQRPTFLERPKLRSPMSWTADTAQVFTTGTPYRALAANVATHNVVLQQADWPRCWRICKGYTGAAQQGWFHCRGSFEQVQVSGTGMAFEAPAGSERAQVVISPWSTAGIELTGCCRRKRVGLSRCCGCRRPRCCCRLARGEHWMAFTTGPRGTPGAGGWRAGPFSPSGPSAAPRCRRPRWPGHLVPRARRQSRFAEVLAPRRLHGDLRCAPYAEARWRRHRRSAQPDQMVRRPEGPGHPRHLADAHHRQRRTTTTLRHHRLPRHIGSRHAGSISGRNLIPPGLMYRAA